MPASAMAFDGAAGRDQFHTRLGKRRGEFGQARLVRNRKQGAAHRYKVGRGDILRDNRHAGGLSSAKWNDGAVAQAGRKSNRRKTGVCALGLWRKSLAVRSRELPVNFLDFGRLEGKYDLAAAARPAEAGEIDRIFNLGQDFLAGHDPAVRVRGGQHQPIFLVLE